MVEKSSEVRDYYVFILVLKDVSKSNWLARPHNTLYTAEDSSRVPNTLTQPAATMILSPSTQSISCPISLFCTMVQLLHKECFWIWLLVAKTATSWILPCQSPRNLFHHAAVSFLVGSKCTQQSRFLLVGRNQLAPPAPMILRLGAMPPMGFMDSISNFLQCRQGDFVKLQDSDKEPVFGPGPLLLLYRVPPGIDNDEVRDMLADAAPTTSTVARDCRVVRLHDHSPELDCSLQEALQILQSRTDDVPVSPASAGSVLVQAPSSAGDTVAVLFFSGFRNDDMRRMYDLLGKEIYEETAGRTLAACAKAVPRAMTKPLRQVLEEIAGDHRDALRLDPQPPPAA